MARRNPPAYNAGGLNPEGRMPDLAAPLRNRRGITVLALVLLVIAIVVAIVLITRYVAV